MSLKLLLFVLFLSEPLAAQHVGYTPVKIDTSYFLRRTSVGTSTTGDKAMTVYDQRFRDTVRMRGYLMARILDKRAEAQLLQGLADAAIAEADSLFQAVTRLNGGIGAVERPPTPSPLPSSDFFYFSRWAILEPKTRK